MKKYFLSLILGIYFISLVSAVQICIDKDPPSLLNSTLTLTQSYNTVLLTWIPATDIPDCSGIDYYEIYRSTNGVNFTSLVKVSGTQYEDSSLQYGLTYYYMVHVFDRAGHNEGAEALAGSVQITSPQNGGNGGGGGGSSGVSNYFRCGSWGECIDGVQTRTCVETNGNLPDRIETQTCTPSFIPTSSSGGTTNQTTSEEQTSTNFLTGAVIGITDFVKENKTPSILLVAILVVVVLIIIRNYKYKKQE